MVLKFGVGNEVNVPYQDAAIDVMVRGCSCLSCSHLMSALVGARIVSLVASLRKHYDSQRLSSRSHNSSSFAVFAEHVDIIVSTASHAKAIGTVYTLLTDSKGCVAVMIYLSYLSNP